MYAWHLAVAQRRYVSASAHPPSECLRISVRLDESGHFPPQRLQHLPCLPGWTESQALAPGSGPNAVKLQERRCGANLPRFTVLRCTPTGRVGWGLDLTLSSAASFTQPAVPRWIGGHNML